MFFSVVALGRGRKKTFVRLGFRNTGGKTVSESSEEESEPRQQAGLCPGVPWSICLCQRSQASSHAMCALERK